MLRSLLIRILLGVIPVGLASAAPIPITMQFTATGFPANAPDATVSGTIKWVADTAHDPVQQLTFIELTIANHAYSLGEIEFVQSPSNPNLAAIGGKLSGGDTVTTGTTDFEIAWSLDSSTAGFFEYADAGVIEGPFFGQSFSIFSVTADTTNGTAAPEPATGVLLGLALGGMALMRRRSAS